MLRFGFYNDFNHKLVKIRDSEFWTKRRLFAQTYVKVINIIIIIIRMLGLIKLNSWFRSRSEVYMVIFDQQLTVWENKYTNVSCGISVNCITYLSFSGSIFSIESIWVNF